MIKTLVAIGRELIGLFIDDGWLALAILIIVVLAAISASLAPTVPIMGGLILLLGCLGALFASVLRAGGPG